MTQINWNQAKPTIKYTINSDPESETSIEADHVIVTIPLGVLKNDFESMFVPELPISKVNAIRSLSYGVVNKIFMTFEEQWWPNDTNLFIIWTDNDIENLEVIQKFIFLFHSCISFFFDYLGVR